MAAQRTAQQIVTAVREEMQLFTTVGGSQIRYRDGFAADVFTAPATSILSFVNRYLSDLAILTGFAQTTFTSPFVSGSQEYAISSAVISVLAVYSGGKRLKRTTLAALDRDEPGWTGSPIGVSQRYYRLGTGKMGFWPTPNNTANFDIKATTHAPDLAATGDVIAQLPAAFNELVVYGSTLKLINANRDRPESSARMDYLISERDRMEKALAALLDQEDADEATQTSLDTYYQGLDSYYRRGVK